MSVDIVLSGSCVKAICRVATEEVKCRNERGTFEVLAWLPSGGKYGWGPLPAGQRRDAPNLSVVDHSSRLDSPTRDTPPINLIHLARPN